MPRLGGQRRVQRVESVSSTGNQPGQAAGYTARVAAAAAPALATCAWQHVLI